MAIFFLEIIANSFLCFNEMGYYSHVLCKWVFLKKATLLAIF